MADMRPYQRDNEPRNRQRAAVFSDSKLMKDARRVTLALMRVRRLVERFAEQDSNHLAHLLIAAGFTFDEDETQEVVADADYIIDNVRGFAWALDAIIATLRTQVPSGGN